MKKIIFILLLLGCSKVQQPSFESQLKKIGFEKVENTKSCYFVNGSKTYIYLSNHTFCELVVDPDSTWSIYDSRGEESIFDGVISKTNPMDMTEVLEGLLDCANNLAN